MSKGLIVFVVITGIAAALYLMKRSADVAINSSDNLLKEFDSLSKKFRAVDF